MIVDFLLYFRSRFQNVWQRNTIFEYFLYARKIWFVWFIIIFFFLQKKVIMLELFTLSKWWYLGFTRMRNHLTEQNRNFRISVLLVTSFFEMTGPWSLRTCCACMTENRSFPRRINRFVTDLYLIKCLKQIKIQRFLHIYAPMYVLPSNISTMIIYRKPWIYKQKKHRAIARAMKDN